MLDGIDECEICGMENPDMIWADLHGEAMCEECGTPYMLREDRENSGEIMISDKWIGAVKGFYDAMSIFVPHGQIVTMRDRPESWEQNMKDFQMFVKDEYEELIEEG